MKTRDRKRPRDGRKKKEQKRETAVAFLRCGIANELDEEKGASSARRKSTRTEIALVERGR